MTTNPPNPYAAPQPVSPFATDYNLDFKTHSKIDAVIKDAGQFWLAILMCIFCTGLGAMIIGPWYLVRLLQWNSIAQANPILLDQTAPRGSLPQRFQSAKIKLIIGISFGALILLLVVASILFLVIASISQAAAQAV